MSVYEKEILRTPSAPVQVPGGDGPRSEEHTSELQSQSNLVCRLLLEKKKKIHLSSSSASSIRSGCYYRRALLISGRGLSRCTDTHVCSTPRSSCRLPVTVRAVPAVCS